MKVTKKFACFALTASFVLALGAAAFSGFDGSLVTNDEFVSF